MKKIENSTKRVQKCRKKKRAAGYKKLQIDIKPENERAIRVFNDALEIGFIIPKRSK